MTKQASGDVHLDTSVDCVGQQVSHLAVEVFGGLVEQRAEGVEDPARLSKQTGRRLSGSTRLKSQISLPW